MAGSGRRGGAERVLESRHLVGLFLGVVLLCGVFFTLGYVMGKTQYGGLVHAAEALSRTTPERPSVRPAPATPAGDAAPANGEWDFYSKNNNNDRLQPAAKPFVSVAHDGGVSPAPAKPTPPAPTAKAIPASERFQAPRISKNSVVLQVAALTHQGDALAMADALQQKRFPAFVVAPTSDSFYRVQVGPYSDAKAAESAKSALDRAGFKAIIKR
jgi:DedD protein